jgi:hypothetical protein
MNREKMPEERLLSAVVSLAIQDVCLPPIKIILENKKKTLVLSHHAQSAYEFLFGGHGDGYYAALDMDAAETKKRLLHLLSDVSHNKPFDGTSKNIDLISRKKRIFRLNHKLYGEGKLRGNFKEAIKQFSEQDDEEDLLHL